jgi:hypothetical protein
LLRANPTESVDDALDAFVAANNSAQIERFLELSEQAATAMQGAVNKEQAIRVGPDTFYRGLVVHRSAPIDPLTSSERPKAPEMPDNSVRRFDLYRCFPAIPDYIAPQRVWFARSIGRASFLGALRAFRIPGFERDPEKWVPVFRRDRAPAIVRPEETT